MSGGLRSEDTRREGHRSLNAGIGELRRWRDGLNEEERMTTTMAIQTSGRTMAVGHRAGTLGDVEREARVLQRAAELLDVGRSGTAPPLTARQEVEAMTAQAAELSRQLDAQAKRLGFTLDPHEGDTVHESQLAGLYLTPATADRPGELVGVLRREIEPPQFAELSRPAQTTCAARSRAPSRPGTGQALG